MAERCGWQKDELGDHGRHGIERRSRGTRDRLVRAGTPGGTGKNSKSSMIAGLGTAVRLQTPVRGGGKELGNGMFNMEVEWGLLDS